MEALTALRMPVPIYRKPVEVESQMPFDEDDVHRSYDAEYANRCWRIVCSSTEVLTRFRSAYYGKASPVHFFWGASTSPSRGFRAASRLHTLAAFRIFPIA